MTWNELANKPERPSFTNDDQLQAQAYISQRALLFQLWDLATLYPNIASKIEVRIRKADPRRDYRYDDRRFGDAAIVVTLAWLDSAEACSFVSCTPRFARAGKCRHGDEPHIFPSGDYTTLTACEPSCFLLRDSQRGRDFGDLADLQERFRSNAYHVMSTVTGEYERHDPQQSLADITKSKFTENRSLSTTTSGEEQQQQQQQPRSRLPDMPHLSYNKQRDTCEIANSTLFEYATLPYTRSEEHNVCRQDNFLLGDDLVYAPLYDHTSNTTTHELTARHSRAYCEAFDKSFDPKTRTCYVPWWEQAVSYTFVGTALMRLGHHAAYGGDRCDTILPTSADRPPTDEHSVPANIRSRAGWFGDVDRHGWCLPPPNVLLSDLGIRDFDQVWSNRNGGMFISLTEHVRHKERRKRHAVRDDATSAANILQQQRRRDNQQQQQQQQSLSTSLQLQLNQPFAGSVKNSDYADIASTDKDNDRVLDFDQIYEHIRGSTGPDNPAWTILKELPVIGAQILAEYTARKLTKLAYNRALRFVGQRLAGTSSRALLGMGVRVGVARMVSAVLARYSTRIMLALGSVASGVGTVIGIIEFVSILLDVMLMFGWDPGNYNSEFDNAIYDDMAIGYVQQRRVTQVAAMDPYLLL